MASRATFRLRNPLVLLGVAALFVAGCTASRSASGPADTSSLDATVARYEGTPYRYGGTSARGFDCSGFIQRVFAEAFALDLPRTTRGQARMGRAVDRDEIRRGDLVFFKIDGKGTRHAGVYLGAGQFAHASSSRGVTVSDFGGRYWQQRYWTARRVLAAPGRAAAPPAHATSPSTHDTDRTGW